MAYKMLRDYNQPIKLLQFSVGKKLAEIFSVRLSDLDVNIIFISKNIPF